jgi:N-acetylmuramoyl-L-alanine amidase
MHGELIAALQKALKLQGFDPGAIDGVFGPHTEAALRGFQLKSGLNPDGEAGKVTLTKLGLPF